MATDNKTIFGILFLTVKSVNFKDIILKLDTIRKLSIKIRAYKSHLLVSRSLTEPMVLKCNISGKEAISKPTAGTGTPLNEKACESSRLNLPSR